MIDLFDLYQSFKSIANIYVGGWWRPQLDFTKSSNDISNEIWEIETRKAEKSQEARDNLFPFLVSKNIICKKENSSYSVAKAPADYGRFASAKVMVTGKSCVPCQTVNDGQCVDGVFESDQQLAEDYYNTVIPLSVELIDEQKWSACLGHKTKAPGLTEKKPPKMNQINSQFHISPRDVSVVVLSYYVRPTDATFIYTSTTPNIQTGAGDAIIYNKNQSTPLQWPSTMVNEFLWRLGERYGYYTRDQFFSAMSKNNKEKAA